MLAGLAGGITFFIMGWLIYGMVLANYMAGHSNPAITRPLNEMIWWALILSNLSWAFLLTIIYEWSNVRSWMVGASRGAILGLFLAISIDFGFYAMYTMYTSVAPLIIDILASVVMFAVVGAVIGWVLNKRGKR